MDVKTLCLGILSCGDATGYEIKKHFEDGPMAYFYDAGYGSIYPALNKMSDEGLVSFKEMAQEGRPDKKVYSINQTGLGALKKALHGTPHRDKLRSDYMFMFMFTHLINEERRKDIYEEYLAFYRERAAEMKGEEDSECAEMAEDFDNLPGHDFVHGFGLAIYSAAIDFMENNRHLMFSDDEKQVAEKRSA
ncbi:MAG: PadR family transcriptional regulator [Alphaproteobacteria bacterium]|nr:PadR family transcriptional regulator [Rhodospirillales bacterium]MCW9046070.1 PadR family transcriptional regulator [Alphaproteobacteria bacterium]